MKSKIQLFLLCCTVAVNTSAQKSKPDLFKIGDPAPPLRVRSWIKGTPVKSFEKGKVYIVEFWATWCKPCIAAMPHLSALAREYKGKVTVLAVDVSETKTTSLAQIKAVVDRLGNQMDFAVAAEEGNFMAHNWLERSGSTAIPRTFVVNGQGKVEWMGVPNDLADVLPKILNNTWDVKKDLSKRASDKHLEDLDHQTSERLGRYLGDYYKLDDLGQPDSILLVINKMVAKEPKLKYAPGMVLFTFSALLRTNPHKAYEFGKKAMVTSTYDGPAYSAIIGPIEDGSRKLKIPAEIYRLGAECYQARIDNAPYPELFNQPQTYYKIAAWYSLAGEGPKAIEALQKAIKLTHK